MQWTKWLKAPSAPELVAPQADVYLGQAARGNGVCPESRGVPRGNGRGRPQDILEASLIARIFDPEKTDLAPHRRQALLATALESLPDGVLMLDLAGKELAYNRKLAEMWRIPTADYRHSALMRVASRARNPRGALDKIRAISATPDAASRAVLELKDGRMVEFRSASHTMNGTRVGTVFSFRDVTEAKLMEADLRHCASHDPLTPAQPRAAVRSARPGDRAGAAA